jgi:hypothetical protein
MLQLSSQDKQLLLSIARGAVRSHLGEASFRKPEINFRFLERAVWGVRFNSSRGPSPWLHRAYRGQKPSV